MYRTYRKLRAGNLTELLQQGCHFRAPLPIVPYPFLRPPLSILEFRACHEVSCVCVLRHSCRRGPGLCLSGATTVGWGPCQCVCMLVPEWRPYRSSSCVLCVGDTGRLVWSQRVLQCWACASFCRWFCNLCSCCLGVKVSRIPFWYRLLTSWLTPVIPSLESFTYHHIYTCGIGPLMCLHDLFHISAQSKNIRIFDIHVGAPSHAQCGWVGRLIWTKG